MIDIDHLSIAFRNEGTLENVVNDISFKVNPGSVLGIVGESGAGKSVVALAILGLLPAGNTTVTGTIRFNGNDLLKLSVKQIQQYRGNRIAMIFQEPMTSLNPVLTCGFQVAETIKRHTQLPPQAVRARVLSLFEEVKLPDPLQLYDRYPHELSGGQKQRVMIAIALSCDPELLIADEPTTALDATIQKVILDLLADVISRRNMSMIFISHDLRVIRKIADEVLVMKSGKLVEIGPARQLLTTPSEPYTRALLLSRPAAGQKLHRLPIPSDFTGSLETGSAGTEPMTDTEVTTRLSALYSQQPLMQVKALETWFPAKKSFTGKTTGVVKAVDGVTFNIYPGEILGVVGESGSGKTTLGRSILRLIAPTSGAILYKGEDLLGFNRKDLKEQRKKMQIMFQDPYSSLNPVMSIGEALMEPLRVHQLLANDRTRKEFAIYLLEKVQLKAEHFNRYPHEFSGGQRQRIGIARALTVSPEFIVCDETVSALDVSVQARVLNLLQDLQKEFNLTYLFISHDLAVVYHLCDTIIVMNEGKIEETGPAKQLFERPQRPYTQKLLEAAL